MQRRFGHHAPGAGSIAVVRGARGSHVTRAFATSPLKWLTPVTRGPAAWIFSSSYGGGLVDGDRVVMDIDVGARARALISTQASTKVYRTSQRSEMSTRAMVGESGLLVSLPDPVVCFADSVYRQTQRFDLALDAGGLVALDWMTSGRLAHGERWAFSEYHATTDIYLGDRCLVHDVTRLSQRDGELSSRLGRFDVLALLVIAGRDVAGAGKSAVDRVQAIAPVRRPSLVASAATIGDGLGAIIRIAAMRLEDVRGVVRELLTFVPELVGDDPWTRKW